MHRVLRVICKWPFKFETCYIIIGTALWAFPIFLNPWPHFNTTIFYLKTFQAFYLEKTVDVNIHSILSVRTEMALEMRWKVVSKMSLHLRIGAKDVALELFEEIVEVEVEVACTGSRIGARATRSIVDTSLLGIWQNFVSCKQNNIGFKKVSGQF